MSQKFVNSIVDQFNITKTENESKAFKSTKSYVLDLFGLGGSSRNLDESTIRNMVQLALSENLEQTLRTIFYLGDVRGGQRARRFFEIAIKEIVKLHPDRMKRILHLLPEYTRWDMLYLFIGTQLERNALEVLKQEINSAIKENRSSLVFKWLKSPKTTSKESMRLAKITRDYLGLTDKEYRQLLVRGRKQLNLVECNMSQNNWDKINFEHVPSLANLKYKRAFAKHNLIQYNEHLNKVMKGEAKMNMGVTYPHTIIAQYRNGNTYNSTLEAAWKSLPNYLKDVDGGMLVMADVSGSMKQTIDPISKVEIIDIAVGLAIYTAERLSGPFKNKFMTFSERPEFVTLPDNGTLQSKISITRHSNWQMNTNIDLAMEAILRVGVHNSLPQKDLPKTLLIISDMQFDGCASITNLETWGQQFKRQGYKLPQIVFWNVNAYKNMPTTMDKKGVALVSGYSPSILEEIYNAKFPNPFELMLKVIMKERYDIVANLFMNN